MLVYLDYLFFFEIQKTLIARRFFEAELNIVLQLQHQIFFSFQLKPNSLKIFLLHEQAMMSVCYQENQNLLFLIVIFEEVLIIQPLQ